jgi:hypothetical protein
MKVLCSLRYHSEKGNTVMFLKKLVERRNNIKLIFCGVLLIFLVIHFAFSTAENLLYLPIVTLVGVVLFYTFIRLVFGWILKNASRGYTRFVFWIFLIGSIYGVLNSLIFLVGDFPNGYTPMLGIAMAIFVGILDDLKKKEENNHGEKETDQTNDEA